MNRPIKFRGKRADNGKWVYGDSIKHTDNPTNGHSIEEIIYIGSKVTNTRKCGAMKWVPIDPATVGQFTGITDCCGKEIYEGDIVETFSVYLAYQQVGNYPPPNIEVEEWEVKQSVNEVEFSYGSFNINGYPIMFEDMVCGDDKDDKSEDRQIFESLWEDNCYDLQDEYPYLTWEYFCKPHIIGNIHDNPEYKNK